MIDDSLILKVHGISAGSFLQEQLDGDLDALAQGHWTYATYCNEEGKVLAFLWVFPWADGILLRLPRSTAPTFLAHIEPRIDNRDVRFTATALHFGALVNDSSGAGQEFPKSTPIPLTASCRKCSIPVSYVSTITMTITTSANAHSIVISLTPSFPPTRPGAAPFITKTHRQAPFSIMATTTIPASSRPSWKTASSAKSSSHATASNP